MIDIIISITEIISKSLISQPSLSLDFPYTMELYVNRGSQSL